MELHHLQGNGTGNHHVKQNKPDSEKQISPAFFSNVESRLKNKQCEGGEVRVTVIRSKYNRSTLHACVKMS
jgi:hypothetical protein